MNDKDVKQFVWFESFTNAIEQLPTISDKAIMALAIFEYGALGKEPVFPKKTETCQQFVFSALFEACRKNIDNSVKAYENGKKGASAGNRGGRPRNGETKEEAKQRRVLEEFKKDLKVMGLEKSV